MSLSRRRQRCVQRHSLLCRVAATALHVLGVALGRITHRSPEDDAAGNVWHSRTTIVRASPWPSTSPSSSPRIEPRRIWSVSCPSCTHSRSIYSCANRGSTPRRLQARRCFKCSVRLRNTSGTISWPGVNAGIARAKAAGKHCGRPPRRLSWRKVSVTFGHPRSPRRPGDRQAVRRVSDDGPERGQLGGADRGRRAAAKLDPPGYFSAAQGRGELLGAIPMNKHPTFLIFRIFLIPKRYPRVRAGSGEAWWLLDFDAGTWLPIVRLLPKGYSQIRSGSVSSSDQHRGLGGLNMKKFLLASVAFAAIAGPAMAADMRLPPPPPPVVYYDWTGAYIGFNAAAIWSDVDHTFADAAARLDQSGKPSGLAAAMASSASTPARSGSGAAGFWVREAALSGCFQECRPKAARFLSTIQHSDGWQFPSEHKITNLFTAGGRLGYAWDRFMIFGTGGWASADLKGTYCSDASGLCMAPAFKAAHRAATVGMPAAASTTWFTRDRWSM